jgi:hypothetical protein
MAGCEEVVGAPLPPLTGRCCTNFVCLASVAPRAGISLYTYIAAQGQIQVATLALTRHRARHQLGLKIIYGR